MFLQWCSILYFSIFYGIIYLYICICQASAPTIVVWEADAQVDLLDLLLKQIFLIEEKHDGGQGKESVVADAVE